EDLRHPGALDLLLLAVGEARQVAELRVPEAERVRERSAQREVGKREVPLERPDVREAAADLRVALGRQALAGVEVDLEVARDGIGKCAGAVIPAEEVQRAAAVAEGLLEGRLRVAGDADLEARLEVLGRLAGADLQRTAPERPGQRGVIGLVDREAREQR